MIKLIFFFKLNGSKSEYERLHRLIRVSDTQYLYCTHLYTVCKKYCNIDYSAKKVPSPGVDGGPFFPVCSLPRSPHTSCICTRTCMHIPDASGRHGSVPRI